jgi:hypothetical protein
LVTIPISERAGSESAAYFPKIPLDDWNTMDKMMKEKYPGFFLFINDYPRIL